MTPAETIAAAIKKLETLRGESTQPTGGTSWIQGDDKRPFETREEIYTGPMSDTSADVASWVQPADAALIVTLHRTIDAQIRVLQLDLRRRQNARPAYGLPALDLARAILGEDQ